MTIGVENTLLALMRSIKAFQFLTTSQNGDVRLVSDLGIAQFELLRHGILYCAFPRVSFESVPSLEVTDDSEDVDLLVWNSNACDIDTDVYPNVGTFGVVVVLLLNHLLDYFVEQWFVLSLPANVKKKTMMMATKIEKQKKKEILTRHNWKEIRKK